MSRGHDTPTTGVVASSWWSLVATCAHGCPPRLESPRGVWTSDGFDQRKHCLCCDQPQPAPAVPRASLHRQRRARSGADGQRNAQPALASGDPVGAQSRPAGGPAGRARAFAAALPSDVAFSHITSARLLGLPLPSRIVDSALDVMRSSDRTRIRRTGCRGHRGLETRGVEIVKGLRVVCGPDTWCDLGDLLPGLLTIDDLILIGDAIRRVPGRHARTDPPAWPWR